MNAYAENELLSRRVGRSLNLGKATSIYVDGDETPTGVQATQTLTSTGTAPANNDTVTIGSKVYTFKTTLTGAADEVLIGASAAIALDNLKSAINATAGAGTTYGTGTVAHTQVTATTNTDTTQVVQAISYGTVGNAIATTETSAQLSWGAATLANGVDQTPAMVQANILANSVSVEYETMQRRVALAHKVGQGIGDITTQRTSDAQTVATIVGHTNEGSGTGKDLL